jgi:hypothetical protein
MMPLDEIRSVSLAFSRCGCGERAIFSRRVPGLVIVVAPWRILLCGKVP